MMPRRWPATVSWMVERTWLGRHAEEALGGLADVLDVAP